MCKGTEYLESCWEFGLRVVEAGNLRKPSQLSRLEMVAVAIWSGTERRILRGTDSREFKEVQLTGPSH